MFSSGLFGSAQPATPVSLWGSAQQASPTPGLFSTPSQQKSPQQQSSIFATPSSGTTTGGLFGSAAGVAQPSTSLFATAAPSSAFSGWQSATPPATSTTGLFGAQPSTTTASLFQQQLPPTTQEQQVPAEIPPILSNLSNADIRSYQVLLEIYNRLRRFSTEAPSLVAFTYEVDFDFNSLQQKQVLLEQQLMQLRNPTLIEAYTNLRRKNPDPSKYAIIPLQSCDGVVKRAETQLQHLDRVKSVVLEFTARQERIGNHMKITTTKRLDDISKRQKCLQSTLVRVVGLLEEYAIRNSRAQLDVSFLRRLQDDVSNLADELYDSSAGRSKLSESRNRLGRLAELAGVDASIKPTQRQQQQASYQQHLENPDDTPRIAGDRDQQQQQMSATAAQPTLSDSDVKLITNIIGKQKTLFESLGSALHQDLSKIKRLTQLAKSQGFTTSSNPLLAARPGAAADVSRLHSTSEYNVLSPNWIRTV